MIAITLVFTVLFVLMALVVGGLAGWVYREYVWSQRPENIHPEMFDANGNLMPDEIIAFRFEDLESEEEPED
jgi:hypothetical protein